MRKPCPECFSATGYSIVLNEDGDNYTCPKNFKHRYKKDKEGDLQPLE